MSIKIIYPDTPDIDKREYVFPSIMVCGPTPREANVKSWRPDLINILESYGFDGTIYNPEASDGVWKTEYYNQIEWELESLNMADLVLFWIPRDIETMPAFTTNVEFGMFLRSGKILYGRPDDAPKNKYLDHCYKKITSKDPINNMNDLSRESINFLFRKVKAQIESDKSYYL